MEQSNQFDLLPEVTSEQKPILFSCHNANDLLTQPKTIKDKEAGLLSETTKTLVEDKWLKDQFGYKEPVMTPQLMKGLLCEQDVFGLVQKVLGGEFRRKNPITFQNEYIIGTPDVILKNEDYVEDVKSSWSLKTFFNAELTPLYNTQAQCYMWLTGKRNYRLIYGLVPTPFEFILDEQRRFSYKFGMGYETNPDYLDIERQIDHNNSLIETIPIEKRIKVFEFKYDETVIENLKSQIEKARKYYNTLSL